MKFTLSTEDINAYDIQVITEGIKIPTNRPIPILLGHDDLRVLGKWTNFKKENGVLTAEPEWDYSDPETSKTIGKIEKGFIDGVSVGLSIDKVLLEEDTDVMVLTETTLLEASITPLPANDEARITKNTNKQKVTFALTMGKEKDIDKIREELLASKKVNNSAQHNSPVKQISDKIKADEEKKKNEEKKTEKKVGDVKEQKKEGKKTTAPKKKVVKETKVVKNKLDIDETIDPDTIAQEDEGVKNVDNMEFSEDAITLGDRIIKMFDIKIGEKDNKYSKIILELKKLDDMNKNKVVELGEKIEGLVKELSDKDKKIQEFEDNKLKLEADNYLKNAMKEGKIDNEQYKEFLNLSIKGEFESVKKIVKTLKVSLINERKLTDKINLNKEGNGEEHNFEWYQRHDSKGLLEMKKNDAPRYEELLKRYLG